MRPLLLLLLLTALPSAGRAQPSPSDTQAQALFVEAMTRAFLDDHEGAIARYREVLEQVPGQPTVLSALAESYVATGQAALAQDAADEAARRDPQNPHFTLAAARIAGERGDVGGARSRYEALLAQHPGHPAAVEALAALHEQAGAHAEAARMLEQLPPTAEVLVRLLGHYERLNEDAAFLRTYEKLTTRRPPDALLLARLGAHHLRHSRPGEARAAFLAALERDPSQPEARAALAQMGVAAPEAAPSPGLAAYAAGDFDEAARLLQRALDLDPRDPDRWAQAAMAYLEAGHMADAARVIEDGRLIFFDYPPLLVAALYEALARGDEGSAGVLLEGARAGLADASPLHRDAVAQAESYVARRASALTPEARAALQAQALAPSAALEARLGTR